MKLLIISLLFFSARGPISVDPCENVELKVEIENSQEGKNNGSLEIEIEESNADITVFLFGDKRFKNQLNLHTHNVQNLASGHYFLIVQTSEGCTKTKKVTIK